MPIPQNQSETSRRKVGFREVSWKAVPLDGIPGPRGVLGALLCQEGLPGAGCEPGGVLSSSLFSSLWLFLCLQAGRNAGVRCDRHQDVALGPERVFKGAG